jgi:hypothetical protein
MMLFISLLAVVLPTVPPVTEFHGDLHVSSPTVWKDGDYRVHGNLWLDKNGEIVMKNIRKQGTLAISKSGGPVTVEEAPADK